MNYVRGILWVLLAGLSGACVPSEEDSMEESEAACELPCAPCVNAFNSCTASCVALDQTAIEFDCKSENRAYLSCISGHGVCFNDNAGVENPVCMEESEARSSCIGTH